VVRSGFGIIRTDEADHLYVASCSLTSFVCAPPRVAQPQSGAEVAGGHRSRGAKTSLGMEGKECSSNIPMRLQKILVSGSKTCYMLEEEGGCI
jgi:hypothetical protein